MIQLLRRLYFKEKIYRVLQLFQKNLQKTHSGLPEEDPGQGIASRRWMKERELI